MEVDRFWALVHTSRERLDLADPERAVDEQVAALRAGLSTHSDHDLLLFQERLSEQTGRANRWHLWAAGYLAAGGMSDDAFDYFRLWLVLQGQTAFERVLAVPDSLADLPWDAGGATFDAAEPAGYLVAEILEERGSDPGDALVTASATGEPGGEPFAEDDDEWFEATFPRLVRRMEAQEASAFPSEEAAPADKVRSIAPPARTERVGPVERMQPALAAELYVRGHIHPQDRPMLAAYWLAEDSGGEAVLELASLRGHEPEVSDLWPRALAELGVALPVTTTRATMPWAARRVLDGERDARWLVRMLAGDFEWGDPPDDFEQLVLQLDHVLDWTDRDLQSREPGVRTRAVTARAALDAAVQAMARDDVIGALGALDGAGTSTG